MGIALALFLIKYGRNSITRIGFVFLIFAVIYHGLGELLIALFPGNLYLRWMANPEYIDKFTVLIAFSILCFVASYLVTNQIFHSSSSDGLAGGARKAASKEAGRYWIAYAVVVTVLLALTLGTAESAGYSAYGDESDSDSTLGVAIASLLVCFLGMLAAALVNRFGGSMIFPVFAFGMVIMAWSGQRNSLVFGAAVIGFSIIKFTPYRVRARNAIAIVSFLVFAIWLLTSVRAVSGREAFASGGTARERLDGVIEGFRGMTSSRTADELADTLGYRLDGNLYGSLVWEALDRGEDHLGLDMLWLSVRLAVPSFVDPSKLSLPLAERVPKLYAQMHFGLPSQDMLMTQLGSFSGWFGMVGVIVAAVILGIVLAGLDRWLSGNVTQFKIFVAVVLVYTISQYGRGMEAWLVSGRLILLFAPLILVQKFLAMASVAAAKQG